MADSQDTIALPETRAALEQLVEAAIARLDEMDGNPDDEPTLGASKGSEPSGGDVGRWMAEQIDRLNGESGRGELYRGHEQSQELWASGGDVGEREDVSEDEGAQDDREPEEDDCNPDIEDEVGRLNRFGPYTSPQAQQRKAEVCQAAIEGLRTIQRRKGKKPVNPLQVVSGAIVR